jgi:CHAT domain-containing protein/Tfp pilus assembly protein PilF
MKKTICIGTFLLFTFSGFGQVVDTAAVVRVVDSLTTVAWNLTNKSSMDEAIRVGRAALDLSHKLLGNQHEWYGTSAFTLGRAYHASGKYELAETFYREALSIREKIHGQMHMDYCMVLTKIATLYAEKGRYKEAEPLLLQALVIPEKNYGKEHRDYVVGLLNLGNLYNNLSRYEETEKLFLEAKNIQEKILGKDTKDYAATLNNLAMLYQNLGNYETSEAYYLQAIEIRKRALGIENIAYAGNLVNLSNLLERMGRYEDAMNLLFEAKSIFDKLNSKQTAKYAGLISNIGVLYRKMGRYGESEKFLLEGSVLKEASGGKSTPDYAISLNNLGKLYIETGRYEDARKVIMEAKEIRAQELGEEHPLFAATLSNLGEIAYKEKKWKEAQDWYIKSKLIYEHNYGKEHPEVANITSKLATLYFAQFHYSDARVYFDELALLNRKLCVRATRHSSLAELTTYLKHYSARIDQYYSFIQRVHGILPDEKGIYFDNALFYKGLALESLLKIRTREHRDSAIQKKVELLVSYYRLLEKEYAKSLDKQQNVAELESVANELEKDLTRSVAGFGDIIRQVSWQEVQSALRPGEAAIEFVQFNYYNPEPTDSVLYAALLLKPGMKHPMFIPLCEEKQIKALLPAADGKLNNDQVNELYGSDALYRLLWSPLEAQLSDVRTVYYSPGGLLHRLNLAALPSRAKTPLSDRHDMVMLGSTRQLALNNRNSAPDKMPAALVYGGIQFNMDSTAYPVQPENRTGGQRGLSFVQSDSTLRGDSWNFLKWSEREVDNVQAALQQSGISAQTIRGWQATEESFKQIGRSGPSPRILHVSTHGFFFPDPAISKSRNLSSEGAVFKLSDHPMIRSGLILAGANHAWKTGRALGNREDGILTAYEISQINLSNTELVVLSACETGLGHIEGNEGVYGLQRAFKIAGAKTLVMSLWQVPDYQTQELMTEFYKKFLTEKLPARQALLAAQNEMRRRHYEPYYWAGFVVVE